MSTSEKKKKKKDKSVLEAEIMSFMEKSLKTALDLALDDTAKNYRLLDKRCHFVRELPTPFCKSVFVFGLSRNIAPVIPRLSQTP